MVKKEVAQCWFEVKDKPGMILSEMERTVLVPVDWEKSHLQRFALELASWVERLAVNEPVEQHVNGAEALGYSVSQRAWLLSLADHKEWVLSGVKMGRKILVMHGGGSVHVKTLIGLLENKVLFSELQVGLLEKILLESRDSIASGLLSVEAVKLGRGKKV